MRFMRRVVLTAPNSNPIRIKRINRICTHVIVVIALRRTHDALNALNALIPLRRNYA